MAESKRTPERMDAFLTAIEEGNTKKTAAALAGFGESMLYAWVAEDEEFAQSIKNAEAVAQAAMVKIIRRSAIDTWQAAAWWLERRDRANWGKDDRPDPDAPKDAAVILIPDNSR
jgi:hypothetical protein